MKKNIFLTAILWVLMIFTINAQDIFPNAQGFGSDSRGAYAEGTAPVILTVNSLEPTRTNTGTNTGTLEWALKESYPRIIVFEVGGVIDYTNSATSALDIYHPYCNVYGQTAPSPGITILGASLRVNDHDILIQHIAARFGDKLRPDGTVIIDDAVSITDLGTNVVIDHCSFSWSQDELASSYGNNSTFSNCLMYEPLHYSWHINEYGENEPERHGLGPLLSITGNHSFIRNFLGWTNDRNPRWSVTDFNMVNNLCYTNSYSGTDVSGSKGNIDGVFIGNVRTNTPSMTHSLGDFFASLNSNVSTASRFYWSDNLSLEKSGGATEIESIHSDGAADLPTVTAQVDAASTTVDMSLITDIMPASEVEDYLINNAGMRPWDRDVIDTRALTAFQNRQVDYINSPEALPARAYNKSIYDGWTTTDGNMSSGYDFNSSPKTFTVNGTTITLNTVTTNTSEVLSALNAQLPTGTEAIKHPVAASNHIIIQTTTAGSSETLTITGDDAAVFGIYPDTYTGSDIVGTGYPSYTPTSAALDIPTDPHGDSNSNGYTNLEDWAVSLTQININPSYTVINTSGTLGSPHSITGNTYDDKVFITGSYVNITSCTFNEGLEVSSDNVSITGSNFTTSTDTALIVNKAPYFTFTGNTIVGTGDVIHYIECLDYYGRKYSVIEGNDYSGVDGGLFNGENYGAWRFGYGFDLSSVFE